MLWFYTFDNQKGKESIRSCVKIYKKKVARVVESLEQTALVSMR